MIESFRQLARKEGKTSHGVHVSYKTHGIQPFSEFSKYHDIFKFCFRKIFMIAAWRKTGLEAK